MGSINNPCGISDKFREKYGDIWADIDFETKAVSSKLFKSDIKNLVLGSLKFANHDIKMTYSDLIRTKTMLQNIISDLYYDKTWDKDTLFDIQIKSHNLKANRRCLTKLHETLSDSITTVMRIYKLGLYL